MDVYISDGDDDFKYTRGALFDRQDNQNRTSDTRKKPKTNETYILNSPCYTVEVIIEIRIGRFSPIIICLRINSSKAIITKDPKLNSFKLLRIV